MWAFTRRAGAYLVDYFVIALYALALAALTISLGFQPDLTKFQSYFLSAATLTGPVILGFAFLEARFGVSPGKALFGVAVTYNGRRPDFARSLLRNVGKFLPWELAHIGIWIIPGQPFIDPPGMLSGVLWTISGVLVVIQVMLILITGAGLHDRAAGLRVGPR